MHGASEGKLGFTGLVDDTLLDIKGYSSISTADVQALPDGEKLYLYPNPAVESFEVIHSFNQPIEKLSIRDNNGRKVRTYDKPKPEKFFIADLGSGLYSVEVTILGNTYQTKLVIP